jgi:hypothetical protein
MRPTNAVPEYAAMPQFLFSYWRTTAVHVAPFAQIVVRGGILAAILLRPTPSLISLNSAEGAAWAPSGSRRTAARLVACPQNYACFAIYP